MRKIEELEFDLCKYKLAYYRPDLLDPKFTTELTINDCAYDKLEMEYLDYCSQKSIEPDITYMVGFKETHPISIKVLEKYGKR